MSVVCGVKTMVVCSIKPAIARSINNRVRNRYNLLKHLRNDAGADGAAAFAQREPQTLFQRDWCDQLEGCGDIVPVHDHFRAFGEDDVPRDIGGAHEELRAVVAEKRRVSAAFVFVQHVDFGWYE